MSDVQRLAQVAWNVVAEPGDPVAVALVRSLGAARALGWARWATGVDLDSALGALRAALREPAGRPDRVSVRPPDATALPLLPPVPGVAGVRDVTGAGVPGVSGAGVAGVQGANDLGGPAASGASTRGPATTDVPAALAGPAARRVLGRALARWSPRLAEIDPRRALDDADRIGCRLLVPGDPGWPTALDDLDSTAPLCLWVRGAVDLRTLTARSVALVGARAATAYGEHVAADLAAGIAEAGGLVVSGGAYGIDGAAHRGALAAGGLTVALLAGGVDRTYPAGNHDLLESIAHENGAVVAECPPGTAPVRARFLLRNRLIAALSRATVVVEAAWRSGALSTANHATALLRPLGAVPGPVTSMASVGCHRLIRDGAAVCVTGVADVLELIGPPGAGDGGGSAHLRVVHVPGAREPGVGAPGGAVPGDGVPDARGPAPSAITVPAIDTRPRGAEPGVVDPRGPRPRGAPVPDPRAPCARAGGADVVATDAPGLGTPGVERSGARVPGADVSGVERPGAWVPGADVPGAERPAARVPGVEPSDPRAPGADVPGAGLPGAGVPGDERPDARAPGADVRAAERPGACVPASHVRDRRALAGGAPEPGAVADLPPDDARVQVLDALPLRGWTDVETLARRAGLARTEVEAALGLLELAGRVRRHEGRWSTVPNRR